LKPKNCSSALATERCSILRLFICSMTAFCSENSKPLNPKTHTVPNPTVSAVDQYTKKRVDSSLYINLKQKVL
jgi:hypothetical protein